MVQFTTLAVALVAAASSVTAFTPCKQGSVYCGFHLNSGEHNYTPEQLAAAVTAGGGPQNPSQLVIQHSLYLCTDSVGGISTDFPEDFCGVDQNGGGKCAWFHQGDPTCAGPDDCCKA
ncbi:hypothetical protein CC79DRAFT_1369784 [Sarocladium strictum]